jgi:hypothetical protein
MFTASQSTAAQETAVLLHELKGNTSNYDVQDQDFAGMETIVRNADALSTGGMHVVHRKPAWQH